MLMIQRKEKIISTRVHRKLLESNQKLRTNSKLQHQTLMIQTDLKTTLKEEYNTALE